MLCLSRKIDYALVTLAFLAEREDGPVVSAREIASINDLPLPLVAKILKRLHRNGLVDGVRGSMTINSTEVGIINPLFVGFQLFPPSVLL